MKKAMLQLLCKAVLLSAMTALSGCTSPATSGLQGTEVANAFQTSNVIAVKPYTRTIFSSNDF